MIGFLDGHDAVVVLAVLLFAVLALDDSDGAHFSRQPGKVGSSIRTSTSVGSPSSILVDGTKAKSYGNVMPAGSTFFRKKSAANLRRHHTVAGVVDLGLRGTRA